MHLIDITASPPPGAPPATLFAFYRYFLREHRRVLLWLFVCGFGVACADALVSVFVGKVVAFVGQSDRWAAWQASWPTLLAFLVGIGIVRPLLIYLDLRLRNDHLVAGVTSRSRWISHWHVVRQSWPFFQRDFPGRLAHRVMHTAGSLRETAEAAVRAVWYLLMYGGASLVLLGDADWRLTLPLLVWFGGYVWLLGHFVPRLKARAEGSSRAYSELMAAIVDCYSNILTIKLFSYEATDRDQVRGALVSHNDAQLQHARMITRFMTALTLLNTVLLTGTGAISVALWLNGAIEAEAVAMALPLVWQAASTGGWVAWEVAGIFQNLADVSQGMESIAAPNASVDRPGATTLAVSKGAIEFDRIAFGYGEAAPLLQDFSLAIAAGERIGLVGRSGAGKSTLVSLLLRLYDIKGGTIRIDGQDIAGVSMDSLRARIGVVTQDTSLLHRPIGANILCGRPDASPEALQHALRQSRVSEFIADVRDEDGRTGLEASAGERGAKLSGGQRQRIVLARVLLKDAPILVLDESTAALDSEAAHAIQEQMVTLMAGKTVKSSAQRLSTLARMDRIVVLDAGKIVEQGSHEALIARGGLYASLWQHQTGGRLPGGEHSSFVRLPEE
jgi:ATP-binding cassette subfamily B multidrug efflux pump